jgi:polysaccharide pyruvyl transferase CsaB
MSKIIISGYYGFDNVGDEAILAGIIHSIRQFDKKIEILVLSNNPLLTSNRYEVTAINRNDLKAIIGAIRNSDLFISGGGSLLQDVTSWRSIPYYLGLVFLAQLMGKKTVFYAQGIGPIKSGFYKKILKWVANRTEHISVRDSTSKELLIQLGVRTELIKETVDPVFAYKSEILSKNINSLNNLRIKGDRPLIGISIRPWKDSKYLKTLAKGADYLSELTGGELIIIPMHQREDQGVSENLMDLMEKEAIILEGTPSPVELLSFFKNMDFFLGVRLHSLIFSAISRVPFLGISYDPKIDSFYHDLGFAKPLNIENLNIEDLKSMLYIIWSDRELFVKTTDEGLISFNKKALENAEIVLNLIKR